MESSNVMMFDSMDYKIRNWIG